MIQMVVNKYYQVVTLRLRFRIMKWNSKLIIKAMNTDIGVRKISKQILSTYKYIKIQYLKEIKVY